MYIFAFKPEPKLLLLSFGSFRTILWLFYMVKHVNILVLQEKKWACTAVCTCVCMCYLCTSYRVQLIEDLHQILLQLKSHLFTLCGQKRQHTLEDRPPK